MSKQSKSALKSYFTTGSVPTETQFANLIDSMNNIAQGVGTKYSANTDVDGGSLEVDVTAICVNISKVTGNTYETPDAAAAALISASKIFSSVVDGMKVAYVDANGRVWEYTRVGGEWILNGDRGYMDIDEELGNGYIASSSGNVIVSDRFDVVTDDEGNEVAEYYYGVTPFHELNKMESIYYKGKLESGMSGVYCYDENYNHLGSLVSATSTAVVEKYIKTSAIFAAFPEVKYVRMCANIQEGSTHIFRIETDQASERNSQLLVSVRKDIKNLKLLNTTGFIGFWDTHSVDPEAESFMGAKSILDERGFFLVKEDGANTTVIGELQKNNFMRFVDGTMAPVMVATAAEVAAEGAPGYITEDKGYGIVMAWKGTKYLLNGVGEDSRTMIGIYNEPTTINGVTAKLMEMTGIAADLPTFADGVLRCIPFTAEASSSMDTGASGSYGITKFRYGYYPKHSVHQGNVMTYARAKNGNTENPLDKSIFAEQMAFHKLSHIYASFLKYGTYWLHNNKMFGRGISSSGIGTDETSFLDSGGVRWKIGTETTWSYGSYSTVPKNFYSAADTVNTGTWSAILNGEAPKLQTLEAQMALSYAVENNIDADVTFAFNGGSYYYRNVAGAKGIMEGEMNARLYKDINFTFTAKDSAGADMTVTVQVILQVPVVDGYISWGDVFDYGFGGLEVISVPTDSAENPTRNIDAYLCTLQHQLTDTKPNGYNTDVSAERFDFMGTYEHLGQSNIHTHGSSYGSKLMPYSIVPISAGAGLSTGACAYAWYDKYYLTQQTTYATAEERVGKYFRLGVRGRCSAHDGRASSRSWDGDYLASRTARAYASAYQLRLEGVVGALSE